jgi:hypothetical protein
VIDAVVSGVRTSSNASNHYAKATQSVGKSDRTAYAGPLLSRGGGARSAHFLRAGQSFTRVFLSIHSLISRKHDSKIFRLKVPAVTHFLISVWY